jgi:hypothetical protein
MNAETNAWAFQLFDAAAALSETATSPIIRRGTDGPAQHGMGVFLQIAETKLLVTAAHVIDEAFKNEWPLSVLHAGQDDLPAREAPLTGVSHRTDEKYDVAVSELEPETVKQLENRRFLRLQCFDVRSVRQGGFCVFGFPRSRTEISATGRDRYLNPFSYGAPLFRGDTRAFGGYDPHHHFLIQRSESGVIGRDGKPANMEDDLGGISGSPVFQVWRDDRPRSAQDPDGIRIVGVLIGGQREAFVATRWGRVMDLLWSAFPKLRPMLQLNGFAPGSVTGPAALMK